MHGGGVMFNLFMFRFPRALFTRPQCAVITDFYSSVLTKPSLTPGSSSLLAIY